MNPWVQNSSVPFDYSFFLDGVAALLASNLLLGLPANAFVPCLMARPGGGGGGAAAEPFALSLAAAELLGVFSSLPVLLRLLQRREVPLAMMLLQVSLQLMLVSRPLLQTCICLERYLAVVHPTLFLRLRPLRYRLLVLAVDWLLILLDALVPLLAPPLSLSGLLFLCKSLLFLGVLSYCGLRVLQVLRRPGPSDGAGEPRSSMKRKAFKVIVITLGFNGCTLLLQAGAMGPALLQASLQRLLWATMVGVASSIASSVITPLLYLHRAGKLPCLRF